MYSPLADKNFLLKPYAKTKLKKLIKLKKVGIDASTDRPFVAFL